MENKYSYGYLPAVGGGMWIVYPVGSVPQESYVFWSDDVEKAREKAAELNHPQPAALVESDGS